MTEADRPAAGATGTGAPVSIGRYQVLGVLGRGAMGIVYKAHDPVIGRNVAIKVVRIDAVSDAERAEAIDRFRVEVQAAGRCSHPGIVSVYDFLDQDGDPAIVMELVEGSSLHAVLRDPARRAAIDPAGIVAQVLAALGYAHSLGIIHRDVKPANILLTAAGLVKIADFGIARLSGPAATQTSAMLGTPSYMAPEQLTGDAVDARADLFAVGAIFYEMLVGRPPFAGRSMPDTLARLGSPEPADMSPVLAGAGYAYAEVLRRALSKDRTQRFQRAEDFAAALLGTGSHDALLDAQATVVRPAGSLVAPARGWDTVWLQRVEQQLAQVVGPMARVLVTRAAQEASGPEELLAAVTQTMPNAADRSAFLRAVGGGRVEPSVGSGRTLDRGTATGGSQLRAPRTLGGPVNVSPEASAAAVAALVQFVGPIARVLVRDAAAGATSGRDFIERLCAHVTKPDDVNALRRRLRAEVEPRLV